MENRKKTKIDIISGFLGAGKTTFILNLVEKLYIRENVVILENEFGKINIDQETLGREGLLVKPIQAGCICCSGSGDLYKGIYEIIKEYDPERIIIEPTGIAKLSEIKKLIEFSDIIDQCEIDHVITIVDAKNYYIRNLISKEFFEDQIRASEVVFLSKTEQMSIKELEQVQTNIYKIHPNCLVVDSLDNVSAEQLDLWINHREEKNNEKQPIRLLRNYKNDYESYEIFTKKNIAIDQMKRFAQDIEAGEYGEIHRMKGICKDTIEGWYSVEMVPGETNLVKLASEKILKQQSEICIIGRDLNKEKLNDKFKEK